MELTTIGHPGERPRMGTIVHNKWIAFGHHFAALPRVRWGAVLAAQFGSCPVHSGSCGAVMGGACRS